MRRRRVLGIVSLLAALGAVIGGAHVSSAAPVRTSTIDVTYSCRVSGDDAVSVFASVTLKKQQRPGLLTLTTGAKTTQKNGALVTESQMGLGTNQKGVKIDTSSCRRVKRQVPLSPKGLPGPATTMTPSLFGYDTERCDTASPVLFRLRLELSNGIPSHALLAVRRDDAKERPIAFYGWSPSKIRQFTNTGCTSSG